MSVGVRAIIDINQMALGYKSSITLHVSNTKFIDVKSILGLSITLYRDHLYILNIHGPDEEEARAAMLGVFHKHHLHVEVED